MATFDQMRREAEIRRYVEACECTRGMVLRTRGKSITLGRELVLPDGKTEFDPRLKLTAAGVHIYHLAVMRHTGRWEKTPYRGNLDELFRWIEATMQHLVAEWPGP